MVNEVLEAFLIGMGIWVGGALVIAIFGWAPWFPNIAVPLAFLTAPAMYMITKFHLRNVLKEGQMYAALRLGIIVNTVQFPLDALGSFMIFNYQLLPPIAQEAIVPALMIGYFFMLIVPWWAGNRKLFK